MAWTTTDLEVLEKAIAIGATKVQYADKTVEYRTLNEMFILRDAIKDELGLNGSSPQYNGRRYASFNKGLDQC